MSNYVQFGIFLSLLDGKMHSANELAKKFEVCTKTIYRNANKLACAGFPLTTLSGKNGGIFLASNCVEKLYPKLSPLLPLEKTTNKKLP